MSIGSSRITVLSRMVLHIVVIMGEGRQVSIINASTGNVSQAQSYALQEAEFGGWAFDSLAPANLLRGSEETLRRLHSIGEYTISALEYSARLTLPTEERRSL